MSTPEYTSRVETGPLKEVFVHQSRVLRHFLYTPSELLPSYSRFRVTPTDPNNPPIFPGPTYWANIGSLKDPLMLELRFEPIAMKVESLLPSWIPNQGLDNRVRIALLMTNERYQSDLEMMGKEMYERVKGRGIDFDVVIAPEILGPKLSQEITRAARIHDKREIYLTSLQKGKPQVVSDGTIAVGPPKPWVDKESAVSVYSGTSHPAAQQMLFLDQKIGAHIKEKEMKALVADDAFLTGGTIEAAINLLTQFGIRPSGIVTVLNEGPPTDNIQGIPFVYLTKLPLSAQVPGGFQPIPGTYHGLDYFYLPVGGT